MQRDIEDHDWDTMVDAAARRGMVRSAPLADIDPIEPRSDNPHIAAQINARKRIGYGPIHLLRAGYKVQVNIMSHGRWITVIDEFADSSFSHIVEPLGIESQINDAESVPAKRP